MSSNQPHQTKVQRREAARLKTEELCEASARREHRNMIARHSFIGVADLGVTGGLGYLVYRDVEVKNGARDDKLSSKFPAPSEGLATAKANRGGIPRQVLSDVSWTYGGDPALDTVTALALVLNIYFDYSCSHCVQFGGLHIQKTDQPLNEREITLALHLCKLLEQEWASVVVNTMDVVLDEAPAQSLSFHNAAFKIFSQAIQIKNQSSMTAEGLVVAVAKVNVPEDVSDKFKATIDSDKYGKWIKLGDGAFKAWKLEGIPTVLLKGEKVDPNKLQTPTSLIELVAAATPTAQPSQQASRQPSP